MADRFFPNEMPNFIPETAEAEKLAEKAQDSLTKLLHLPYKNVAEKIQKSALVLKEKVPTVPLLHSTSIWIPCNFIRISRLFTWCLCFCLTELLWFVSDCGGDVGS